MTEVVNSDKYLSTLSKYITITGFAEQLSGKGPFTILAPTDTAFQKLETALFLSLDKGKINEALSYLLNCHILLGKTIFKDFKNGDLLSTLNGKLLQVKVRNGRTSINGVYLRGKGVEGSNGVLHSLDTVLMVS